jgi:hypothetical protein
MMQAFADWLNKVDASSAEGRNLPAEGAAA